GAIAVSRNLHGTDRLARQLQLTGRQRGTAAMLWKRPPLVFAALVAGAGAASAQTLYAAPDVIYETPASAPAISGSSVPSEVATAPAAANAVENPAAQVQGPVDVARPRAYAAPQTYGAA